MADYVSMNDLLPKPDYGAPCNSCGLCCLREQCPLSEIVFGRVEGVCPALGRTGEKTFGCGLIADPGKWIGTPPWAREATSEAISVVLGAGLGCDAGSIDQPTQERVGFIQRAQTAWDAASPEAKTVLIAMGARRPR